MEKMVDLSWTCSSTARFPLQGTEGRVQGLGEFITNVGNLTLLSTGSNSRILCVHILQIAQGLGAHLYKRDIGIFHPMGKRMSR